MGGTGKCLRPGPKTNNGYLNFLRDFRKKCCGLTAIEIVLAGAKAWKRLSRAQKYKYLRDAARRSKKPKCPRKHRKPTCPVKSTRAPKRSQSCPPKRGRSCPPKRRRSCPPKKKKCTNRMKPGPPTNNPFLNFLRYLRRKNCNIKSKSFLKIAARKWCKLTTREKKRFVTTACKMTCSERRKNTKACRMARCEARKRNRAKQKKCG